MDARTGSRVSERTPLSLVANFSLVRLAESVKLVARGQPVAEDRLGGLIALGFVVMSHSHQARLTSRGNDLDSSYNIYGDVDEARKLTRIAFLEIPATQAIIQSIRPKSTLSVDGCFHLLIRHSLASEGDETILRNYLGTLTKLGIVAYSRKLQSIRMTDDKDTSPVLRSDDMSVILIDPEKPYTNIKFLRQLIREAKGYIWWADPHFSRKGLEPLAEEVQTDLVKEIRILSGPAQVNKSTGRDFERFKLEMAANSVRAEWRIVRAQSKRAWHDRFLVTKDSAWNLPPVNTLFKGDYSEIVKTKAPPFDMWWADGIGLEEFLTA